MWVERGRCWDREGLENESFEGLVFEFGRGCRGVFEMGSGC